MGLPCSIMNRSASSSDPSEQLCTNIAFQNALCAVWNDTNNLLSTVMLRLSFASANIIPAERTRHLSPQLSIY